MSDFNPKRVLIVDDDPDLRETMEMMFQSHDFEVASAENGQVALKMILAQPFDAVVSDVRMPEMNGIEMLRQIKAEKSPSPIVFLVTGFADLNEAHAISLGAEGLILKPFTSESLIERVQNALAD